MLAITIVVLIVLAVLAKAAPSIGKRLATRNVEPPLYFTLPVTDLVEHIRTTDYQWQQENGSAGPVYTGTLDRGFGCQYKIVWNTGTGVLTAENIRRFKLWIYESSKFATATVSDMPESIERDITRAIFDRL